MNIDSQNPRPTRVQDTIKMINRELLELFQRMKDDKDLEISKTALIPLARRGIGILPRLNDEEYQENELICILREFGYYEKYALFPHKEKLRKCDAVVIFDDVCESGRSLTQYREYFLHYSSKLNLHYSKEDTKTAAYIVKEDAKRIVEKDTKKEFELDYHLGRSLSGEKYEEKILELYMVIASKGAILDPDHMLIKANFGKKKDFFDVWDKLEKIAESNNCDLVEDGIEFLHPEKKKLGLYVQGDIKENLINWGMTFPDFVTKIDIAKFRMVFNLELGEKDDRRTIFTTGFEAVPIINPIIKNFSVDTCLNSWCPSFKFCENNIISREFCRHEYEPHSDYLIDNYYHPRYDCIIGDLVMQFREHLWERITGQLKDIKPPKVKWRHQERVTKKWLKLQDL